jgi:hypothetical protein
VVVDEAVRLKRIAAGEEALVAAVVAGEVVGDRADDGELVGHTGVQGHVLADVDAGHVGLDGPEVAAVLGGGVRLHVVHFQVRRPARQPNEDDRGIRHRLAGLFRCGTQHR